MFKYLGIGFIIMVIALVIGISTGDWNLFLIVIGAAAVVPLILSGLLTGAFVDGDRNRANYRTETKEGRQGKNKWVKRFLVISAPNFTLLIVLVIVSLMNQ